MHFLDEIRREFEIPHAYENWTGYREQLTDLLLSYGEIRSAALFGIGPANDIDLRRLHAAGAALTLIDADADSVRRGLQRYGLLHSPDVQLVSCSLTGVSDGDTEQFFDTLYQMAVTRGQALTEEDFMDASLRALAVLQKKLPASPEDLRRRLPAKHYDLVASVGLHSQLWSILCCSWLTLAGNIEEQILGHPMQQEAFFDAIRDMDDGFIPILNEVLLSMGDRVILGMEAEEAMVEGAWQSIQDIRRRCPDREECMLHWPFRPEEPKEYDMLLQIVRNPRERKT